MAKYLFFITLLSSALVGCGGGGGSSDGSGGASDSCTPSRGPSEACCVELGVDACGAGLFCAAFDGRTVATCYPEGVRLGGEECRVDSNCVSQSCHPQLGRCRAIAGMACEASLGCSDAISGTYACSASEALCVKTDGAIGSPCDGNSECAEQNCAQGTCAGPPGPCYEECAGCADPITAACDACLQAERTQWSASPCVAAAMFTCQDAEACQQFLMCVAGDPQNYQGCAALYSVGSGRFDDAVLYECANCQ